ncbi:hypothetical protein NDU88_008038 [Pleurodeles waltl]|uniref:Uncharacterized protein n=1 Tax=Pleurodeles waltl TaxID=8319 RepID=A0AAV7PN03_PLEWA|nr:hypothetical protein NDU88_008038 [Pleurodeles waltl]
MLQPGTQDLRPRERGHRRSAPMVPMTTPALQAVAQLSHLERLKRLLNCWHPAAVKVELKEIVSDGMAFGPELVLLGYVSGAITCAAFGCFGGAAVQNCSEMGVRSTPDITGLSGGYGLLQYAVCLSGTNANV